MKSIKNIDHIFCDLPNSPSRNRNFVSMQKGIKDEIDLITLTRFKVRLNLYLYEEIKRLGSEDPSKVYQGLLEENIDNYGIDRINDFSKRINDIAMIYYIPESEHHLNRLKSILSDFTNTYELDFEAESKVKYKQEAASIISYTKNKESMIEGLSLLRIRELQHVTKLNLAESLVIYQGNGQKREDLLNENINNYDEEKTQDFARRAIAAIESCLEEKDFIKGKYTQAALRKDSNTQMGL